MRRAANTQTAYNAAAAGGGDAEHNDDDDDGDGDGVCGGRKWEVNEGDRFARQTNHICASPRYAVVISLSASHLSTRLSTNSHHPHRTADEWELRTERRCLLQFSDSLLPQTMWKGFKEKLQFILTKWR